MLLSVLFVGAGLVTLIASAATNLLSQKPTTIHHHAIGLGRLGVFGSVAFSMSEVLQGRVVPTIEQCVLVMALALIYCAHIRCEVIRQRYNEIYSRRRGHAR